MEPEERRILFSAEQIAEKVDGLGRQVTEAYRGLDLYLVGVLKGCVPFISDLMRRIHLPLHMDLIGITSYGGTTPATGTVRITKDLDEDIMGRHVLLVEGMVDTGLTLNYLLRTLGLRNPASLEVCTLLDKTARRLLEVPIAFKGFSIPDVFVVGYGLDWRQLHRNLPFISIWDGE